MQIVDLDVGVADDRDGRVHDLAQVVGRNVGGHSDRDARGAVDQQIGQPRRQNRGLGFLVVVVGLEFDRLLVDVGQQFLADLLHAALGVAVGSRGITVDRAEVPLSVDERVAHGKILREPNQGVVASGIAVGMELAQDIADHTRALDVRPIPQVVHQVLRIEDTPVHGLESVARVGQSARHDHAHGVVHER